MVVRLHFFVVFVNMEEVKEETNTTKKRKRSDPDISKDETPPKKNKKEKRLKKQGTKTSQEEESNLPLFFALRNLSASDEESHATSELLQSLRSTPLPSLLHQTNREGQTLLHLCLSLSPPSLPILSFFLDEMGRGGEEIPVGEWVDREDKRGETALHVGCRSGWLEGVRQLIKKGADLNGQTKGLLEGTRHFIFDLNFYDIL